MKKITRYMSVAFVALFVLALATPAHAFDLKEGIKGKYGFRVGDQRE
jgi:hypothetical protein